MKGSKSGPAQVGIPLKFQKTGSKMLRTPLLKFHQFRRKKHEGIRIGLENNIFTATTKTHFFRKLFLRKKCQSAENGALRGHYQEVLSKLQYQK